MEVILVMWFLLQTGEMTRVEIELPSMENCEAKKRELEFVGAPPPAIMGWAYCDVRYET